MAEKGTDSFFDLELMRQRLEETMAKLRKSIQYWQTWEAEYEGLKEDIGALSGDADPNEIDAIGTAFEGELLVQTDINELFRGKANICRSRDQIINLISRRIDYVQQNVSSLSKQSQDLETKYENATIISRPDVRNGDGLPITEIYEELDEDGNVISSRLSNPGDAAPQLLEALEKAGVKPEDFPITQAADTMIGLLATTPPEPRDITEPSTPTTCSPQAGPASESTSRTRKKSVSFSEDTKPPPPDPESEVVKAAKSAPGPAILRKAPVLSEGPFTNNQRVIELDDEDSAIETTSSAPTIEESPEDAAMRRRMLQYGMEEVNHIVAELDLEEDSQDSEDDDSIDPDTDDLGSQMSHDDENEFGMDLERDISDDYRTEMAHLEQRLQVQMLQNLGPRMADSGRTDAVNDARRLVVQPNPVAGAAPDPGVSVAAPAESPEVKNGEPKRKSVRFAEELDVAAPQSSQRNAVAGAQKRASKQPRERPQGQEAPLKDTIIERRAPEALVSSATTSTRAPSRFQNARLSAPPNVSSACLPKHISQLPPKIPTPTGPANVTLAETLIERPPPQCSAGVPSVPSALDEFDPALVRQEVSTEYYVQRNRMIQQQGGFRRDADADEVEVSGDEDEIEGGRKKVSLFKKARLRRGEVRW